jgi:hypothetical protein
MSDDAIAPRYTNCNRCNDVVRRDEVDAEGVCELCRDEAAPCPHSECEHPYGACSWQCTTSTPAKVP